MMGGVYWNRLYCDDDYGIVRLLGLRRPYAERSLDLLDDDQGRYRISGMSENVEEI